jgi:hypothetical protein
MKHMVVRKYFEFIEVWVPCEICESLGYAPMVNLRVTKEDINKGLQLGMYTHYHAHGPPGQQPHTVAVYINPKYEVTGSKAFEGTEGVKSSSFQKGAVIPVIVKKIPDMAVHLGMVTPEEFSILKVCDGNNSIDEVCKILKKDKKAVETALNKLKDKGLVDLIKKA